MRNLEGLKLGHGWNKGHILGKKPCLTCGMEMISPRTSTKRWNATKFCSKVCFGLSRHNAVFSQESRDKMSVSRKGQRMGDKNPNWIKDRTKLAKKQERNDSAYREWRMNVWKRDNFKCKMANKDCDGAIVAHHILPWRDYVELRYEITNGITLCHFHHPRKRVEEVNLSPYLRELVKNIN